MVTVGKVLALDYGDARIGIAVSDENGEYAFPRQALQNRGRRQLIEDLRSLVHAEGVERIVAGLPLTMRGERGPQAGAIQSLMCTVEEALNVPVDFEDERLTTAFAGRFRAATADADSIAAAAILESYLERKRWERS